MHHEILLVVKLDVINGMSLYESGNHKDAEAIFEGVLEELRAASRLRSLSKEEWTYKGIAYHRLGHFYDAINCYDESIHMDRRNYSAWYNKAITLQSLGNLSEALQAINRALLINQGSYKSKIAKGSILDDMGSYRDALKCYDEVIAHKNEITGTLYKYALNDKAMTLANMGEYEDAHNWAKNNLEDIDESYILETRAYILLKLGRHDEAEKLLEKSLFKQDRDKFAWYHIGQIFYEKKKYNSAVRCYNRALDIDPEFAEALNDKAVALSAQDMYDEALRHLKMAISVKPSLVMAHENLMKLSLRDLSRPTFWDFWKATWPRRVAAILLGLAAATLVVYGLYIHPESTESKNVVYTESSIVKSNMTTISTKPPKVPNSYLVVIGLIVLVLLSPIIRSAKAGVFEVTLIETDRKIQPLNTV